MLVNILSDLHLGQGALAAPRTQADVVVLAGDIGRPDEAIAWASSLGKPVLYVPGNHEFYGASIGGTLGRLRELCAGTEVRVLSDAQQVIGGVRFLGSTLWTDFLLDGDGEGRTVAVDQALRFMRDYSRIWLDDALLQRFTPVDSATLFQRHSAWLAHALAVPHDGPTVVITHHAPAPASIHPRFAGSPVNACFVSRAEHLLDGERVQLWIHGHTHDSFDYRLNGTRVLCNPRGYARDGVNENPLFDPQLVVEVG